MPITIDTQRPLVSAGLSVWVQADRPKGIQSQKAAKLGENTGDFGGSFS